MKLLKELLFEKLFQREYDGPKDPSDEDIQKMANAIRDNCPQFMKQLLPEYKQENYMWRGIINENSLFILKETRKDRLPRDTSYEVHNIINGWFKKKFGIAYRTEAIFTVRNKSVAESYGRAYVVIPLGRYKFCSSSMIDDIFTFFIQNINKSIFLKNYNKIKTYFLNKWLKEITEAKNNFKKNVEEKTCLSLWRWV